MTSIARTTAVIAAVGCSIVLVTLRGSTSTPATSPAPARPSSLAPSGASDEGAPAGDQSDASAPVQSPIREDLVSYAVAVNELHGLPLNAAPGTALELWVAWEPPVTKRPKIHRLLDRVVIEEISPPLLPDGPHVAMLLVRPNEVSDLLYGDRYGSLSVTIPQSCSAAVC